MEALVDEGLKVAFSETRLKKRSARVRGLTYMHTCVNVHTYVRRSTHLHEDDVYGHDGCLQLSW